MSLQPRILPSIVFVALAACQPRAARPMSDGSEQSFRITGTVHRIPVEAGCWRFDADSGAHYELRDGQAPADLLVDQKQATLLVRRRVDLMSVCMVGPIVDVIQVEP